MLVLTEQVIDTKINYIQTKANLGNILGCTQHLATFQIKIHHFYRLVAEWLVLWTWNSLCKDQMERSEQAIKHPYLQKTPQQQQPGECQCPFLCPQLSHVGQENDGPGYAVPIRLFLLQFPQLQDRWFNIENNSTCTL